MATGAIVRRLLLLIPFGIAAVLNLLMAIAGLFHLQHLEAYAFMFFAPWAWLLDQGWLPEIHNRWFEAAGAYLFVLWIPAALYSGILWLLLRAVSFATGRAKYSRSPAH